MELGELAQLPDTTTIQCTVDGTQFEFTISDAEDIPAGICLYLTEVDTERDWTLAQQRDNTYYLTPEDNERIEVLTPGDITIK